MSGTGQQKRGRRDRVLVELSDFPVLLRALAAVHRRGSRLRELALLGLAAERVGLGYSLTAEGLRLTGLGPATSALPSSAPLSIEVARVSDPVPDPEVISAVANAFF